MIRVTHYCVVEIRTYYRPHYTVNIHDWLFWDPEKDGSRFQEGMFTLNVCGRDTSIQISYRNSEAVDSVFLEDILS